MKYPVLFFLFVTIAAVGHTQQVKDEAFWQEYHEAYPVGKSAVENEVRSIAVDNDSKVWIATAAGVFTKNAGETSWQQLFSGTEKGPAFAVATDEQYNVWVSTWQGVFRSQKNEVKYITGTEGPVSAICNAKEGMYAVGPGGVWLFDGKTFVKKDYRIARSVRSVVSDGKEGIWIATDVGLYHCNAGATKYFQGKNVLLSAYVKGVALDANEKLWAAGLGGVTVFDHEKKEKVIRPEEGCPSVYVNCVKRSPDGVMWIGTEVGVVRYLKDGTHSLLFTRRWLLDDKVKDVAFDKEGNAWIATANGVSAIKKRKMNLAEKQNYFYDILMKRHIREPWIAGQCHLTVPGDISSWQPDDDDNDGEFTGNYLTMESFRYAATGSSDAKEKAQKAFYFLKQLQEVTGGDGFFARSMIPVDWKYRVHDANRNYSKKELAEELVKEPRYKPVETRWRKSADGKWLWKGDASSDEWCGHMMGYFFYYQLVADEAGKEVVRKHVALLVDHIIANNYNMVDVDGTHTRWAVWSPDKLNRDPEWGPDKSQNSMELLTFLKLAFYMTGDNKYQQHYLRLIKEEKYLDNMADLLNQDPAWFIYYDVTMQAYLYPILLHCESDPKLHAFYQKHLDQWMEKRRNDKNPLINFLYCYARNAKVELAASVDFLKNTPLDLIDWSVDHTKREDVKIVHQPVLNDLQVSELPPPDIRVAVRWDKNPWLAVNGYPDMEREPVFWLLPYWMGRYLKMIN
ncbi:MAG: regulator [Chitinophagaceae bacterium]|nr:regulator [Chitinophagaceae bacterium]